MTRYQVASPKPVEETQGRHKGPSHVVEKGAGDFYPVGLDDKAHDKIEFFGGHGQSATTAHSAS